MNSQWPNLSGGLAPACRISYYGPQEPLGGGCASWDVESQYDYFGARYYDARVGRWLSVDPIAEKYPGWNPYSYTFDNPVLYKDPNGKWPEFIHNSLIATAFKGNANIKAWQGASAFADSKQFQHPRFSSRHAMRMEGTGYEEGVREIDQFLSTPIDEGDDFGVKLHCIMDMTSPSHEGIQVWGGSKTIDRFGKTHLYPEPSMGEIMFHTLKELFITVRRYYATVRVMKEFQKYYDPKTKKSSKGFKYFQEKFNEYMEEESEEEREYWVNMQARSGSQFGDLK